MCRVTTASWRFEDSKWHGGKFSVTFIITRRINAAEFADRSSTVTSGNASLAILLLLVFPATGSKATCAEGMRVSNTFGMQWISE